MYFYKNPQAPKKLLIVDDNIRIHQAFEAIFDSDTFILFFTLDPKEALSIIDQNDLDLIILDGGLSYFSTTTFCRSLGQTGLISRVVISSVVLSTAARSAFEKLGVCYFYNKGFSDPHHLRAFIFKILGI